MTIQRRAHRMTVRGANASAAAAALERFYNQARTSLSIDDVQLGLVETRHMAHGAYLPVEAGDDSADGTPADESPVLHTRRAACTGARRRSATTCAISCRTT